MASEAEAVDVMSNDLRKSLRSERRIFFSSSTKRIRDTHRTVSLLSYWYRQDPLGAPRTAFDPAPGSDFKKRH